MHKLQRLIASLGVIAILSTLVVSTATAGSFTDVPDDQWYASYVEDLVAMGAEDAGGNFDPAGDLTRGVAARWLVSMNGLEADMPEAPTFKDVLATNPNYEYIETAYAHGVISGYSTADGELTGQFGPDDKITREQYAKMAVEAGAIPIVTGCYTEFGDGSSVASWARDYVCTAYAYQVIDGYPDGTFGPGKNINRAEGSKMSVNSADPVLRDEFVGDDDDTSDDDDDTTVSGDLEVSLGEVITGATLPSGATSVKVMNIDVTAGSSSSMLKTLKLHRYGVSALPSGNALYIYEGKDRLTSGKSINSTTNYATFNNLNLSLAKGETKHLTVRMDVGTVATTGEFGLEIVSVDDVDAGDGEASLDGSVVGEKFGLSTTAAGTITVEKNGTVSNAKIGEKGATVAKFKLTAATENASLEEFGLYVGGTINTTDIQNFKMYVSGVDDPIAEVETVNGNEVAQLVMDTPYEISKGDTRNFYVTADFSTGRTGDTVLTYVYENTDVVAIGGTYGYGMAVTRTAYDGTTGGACTTSLKTVCNAMTLQGGDITISGTSISNRNLAVNQDDVAVLKFTITAATDVTFDNFGFHLDTGATAEATDQGAGLLDLDSSGNGTEGEAGDSTTAVSNFTDIKIKEVGGNHIWGPIDADELTTALGGSTVIGAGTDTADAFYLFTDDLVLEAGESREFELTFDVANNAALSDETITATLDIDSTYPGLKDANNKTLTNSASLVPTSDYSGSEFTIKTDSLTVSKGNAVGSKSVVIGSTEVEIGAFSFKAGDASPVTVTELNLTGYIESAAVAVAFVAGVDTTAFNSVILGVDIYKGSVSAENKLNSSSESANATTGVITFENLNWEIEAGKTQNLIVVATEVANNTAYDDMHVKVDIDTITTDITSQNADGNPVTEEGSNNPNGGTSASSTLYTEMTISQGGTLAVDVKSPTAPSDIVVAGSTGNVFGTLKFTATEEPFVVTKMALRNARNDAATAAEDYDDNFATVTVNYFTDAAQTVAGSTDCTLSATQTLWTCTGMDMYVPNPNLVGNPNYAYVTLEADLHSLANSQADAGDAPLLTFTPGGDFEASGVESPSKIYEQTLIVTDIGATSTYNSFASYAASSDAVGADLATAADTVLAVTDNDAYVAGTIICIDDEDTGCDATDEKAYVVARCTALDVPHADCSADNDLVLVRQILGTTLNAATAAADDIDVLLPSSYLATNPMSVYGTKLTFAAGTPAHAGQNATEEVMKFTVAAAANGDAQLRAGVQNAADTTTLWTTDADQAIAVETTTKVEGTGSIHYDENTAITVDDSIYYGSTALSADYSAYDYVGFWIYSSDAAAAGNLEFCYAAGDATPTSAELSAGTCGALAAVSAATWTYIEEPLTGTRTDVDYYGVNIAADIDGGDTFDMYIDDIRFYANKLAVDLSLNANATVGGSTAYLKQNGTVVATGTSVWYDGTATSYGTIVFVPVSTYGTVTISGTDTFTVEASTTIFTDSTSTENLTANVDLGGYGTTSGDVWWYDEEGASEVQFAGVTSTDKVSNTLTY